MKKLITIIIVVGVIVAALPIINGILMQKAVDSVFENMNEIYKDTATDYSLEVVSYDRGLFSSEIEWKVNLGKLSTFYGIEEAIFIDRAKHGFTGVVSTTSLEKNPWFTQFLESKLEGQNPFTIFTHYSLFGDIETTFESAPFSFMIENETISVSQGEINIATDRDLKEFESEGEWDGFTVGDKVVFGEMELESDLEMISAFLWNGDASFSVESFSISENGADVAAKNITGKYKLDTDMDKNIMSTESSFSIESITTPDTTVDGAKGSVTVNNIDANAYEEFMKQYMQVISEVLTAITEMEDEGDIDKEIIQQQMTAAGLQMMAAYEKLLTKDLELHIADVEVKLADGDISGDIEIKLLKDMTLMQFAPIVGQPSLILNILYLKTDISLPVSLVGENPMLFNPLFPGMQTGFFIVEDDMIHHTSETRDGKLLLNDQEVNLDQLMQQ